MGPGLIRKQRPGARVVPPAVLSGPLEIGGGITVAAAEDAGIIDADVAAGDAVTELPLPRIFPGRYRDSEEIPDKFIIDASAGLDPIGGQVN